MGYIKKIVQNKIPGIYVLSLKIGSNLIQVTARCPPQFCSASGGLAGRSERALVTAVSVINVVSQGFVLCFRSSFVLSYEGNSFDR